MIFDLQSEINQGNNIAVRNIAVRNQSGIQYPVRNQPNKIQSKLIVQTRIEQMILKSEITDAVGNRLNQ